MQRYTSVRIGLDSILKWQLTRRFANRHHSKAAPMEIIRHSSLPDGDYALWLGHASVALQLGSTRILIDPVLGNIPFYRRHTPLPIAAEHLKTDLILISHAHYDHFDRSSVRSLLQHNPEAIIVAPAGFWRYLKNEISRERCFELELWESLMVQGVFITLVPSLHWSKRTPFDTNKVLWGGFVIQNEKHTLYHSGDTAYGEHFKEISEHFKVDEAFLPIGAYKPEFIMKHNHLDPQEAYQACSDLNAKALIPIHYGTFRLSDEPMGEPLEWFRALASATSQCKAEVLKIGEIYRFNTRSTLTST